MSAGAVVSRPVLRYHGGKWRLAPWIISHFPPHRVYVEPFGGGASVLLRKPRSYSEVYNDLDSELVGLFRVLRDPAMAAELERLIRLTPFARDEFVGSYEHTEDLIERSRRALGRGAMGFGSAAFNAKHATGFRAGSKRSGTTPARDWASYPDLIAGFTERLRGVVLENRPAVEVMAAQDGSDALFYVDPPYVHATRGNVNGVRQKYRHEMTDDEHRALAGVLAGLRGMVALSGYAGSLYDELYHGWQRLDKATHGDGAVDRVESLWLNPACVQSLTQGSLEFTPRALECQPDGRGRVPSAVTSVAGVRLCEGHDTALKAILQRHATRRRHGSFSDAGPHIGGADSA